MQFYLEIRVMKQRCCVGKQIRTASSTREFFHGLRNMLSVIMGWKSTLLSVAGVVIRDDILVD